MLLNYKFNNFMSFHENAEFSMLAPKNKVKNRFPDNYIETNGVDVLRTAVIVGENAGGKSNFVRSLEYFKSMFFETETPKTLKSLLNNNNVQPYCLKEDNTTQLFEIEISTLNNGIFLYHIEIDFTGILSEKFYSKKKINNKYNLIFSHERIENNLDCPNEDECAEKQKCVYGIHRTATYTIEVPGHDELARFLTSKSSNEKSSPGMVITKLAMLGIESCIVFTEYIRNNICPETNIINYDIYKSIKKEDDDLRILHDPRFLEIFRLIDPSIEGYDLDKDKPFTETVVSRKEKNGSIFKRELAHDSNGVREFFAWAVQIFKVVYENKVVIADEMDRVLNPVLSERVLAYVNGKEHSGQFIFTTHNVLHLDLKNYMKEQIFFITKNIETLDSELYSLADFPEIRYETTKIYEFYMKGILGGTVSEQG